MPDNIISLADHRPHLAGPAVCLECRHEWEAVAPVGTARLECPSCHLMKGAWAGAWSPTSGKSKWVCNCDNDLFMLTPEGMLCARCGDPVTGYP